MEFFKRNSYLPKQLHPLGLLGVLWDVGLWEVKSEAQKIDLHLLLTKELRLYSL